MHMAAAAAAALNRWTYAWVHLMPGGSCYLPTACRALHILLPSCRAHTLLSARHCSRTILVVSSRPLSPVSARLPFGCARHWFARRAAFITYYLGRACAHLGAALHVLLHCCALLLLLWFQLLHLRLPVRTAAAAPPVAARARLGCATAPARRAAYS